MTNIKKLGTKGYHVAITKADGAVDIYSGVEDWNFDGFFLFLYPSDIHPDTPFAILNISSADSVEFSKEEFEVEYELEIDEEVEDSDAPEAE